MLGKSPEVTILRSPQPPNSTLFVCLFVVGFLGKKSTGNSNSISALDGHNQNLPEL